MTPMRIGKRGAILAAAAAVVSGCAGMGGYDTMVEAGSRLEVHETLSIQSYSGRVYVQDGEVLRQNDVNIYRPYCSFGLRSRGDEEGAGEIRPGRFEVIQDSRQWYRAGFDAGDGIRVASAGLRRLATMQDGGLDRYHLYTELELRSQEQPQVDNLRCQYYGRTIDKTFRRYPTLGQIDDTLGDVATLVAPGG